MMTFKPKVLRYESLPSTNTEVARLASLGAQEGLTVIAEEQTAGRGRLQRRWQSPRGAGLYFSILLRPIFRPDKWPLITFMAALAVSDALYEAFEIETDIKWPNDLLSGERKICGILAEASDTDIGRAVVLGIGINLTSDAYPAELAAVATSVSEEGTRRPERESLVVPLLQAIERWYTLLSGLDGPEKVLAAWSSRSSYATGKTVKVINGDEVWEGVTRGVESDGALRLEVDSAIRLIRAGDVISVRACV
jgi:BirA family biotin operon repressor/biotin-[acetyl-CoA-carboxylase] ligase